MAASRQGIAAGILVLGVLIGGTGVAGAETTLRFSTYVNEVDVRYQGFEYFADQVAERTNGEVVVKIFGSGTLHPFNKAIDSVLGGVSDISAITGSDDRLACSYVTQFLPMPIDWERHVELDQKY
jgi:TRAP-type C4-dicarboxylate transport system substrate-binding protein